MTIEILMSELKTIYCTVEERQREIRRSVVSLQTGGADYSWLIMKTNEVKLPENIYMEMNELCNRVLPEECNKIVAYFRTRAEKCQSGREVANIFKTTIEEVIGGRVPSPPPKQWVKHYLTNKNPRNRISCTSQMCTDISNDSINDDCKPSTSNDFSMYEMA